MAGSTKYKNDWQKEHLDRINLTVPKGQKETVRRHASMQCESVNEFINRAICETMKHDQKKAELRQQIAQIAGESGKSDEVVVHDMEMDDALSVLQQEVPNIRDIFLSAKQRQLLADKPKCSMRVVMGNKIHKPNI